MRLYESVFIGRQDLSQPQIESVAENVINVIKKGAGEVIRSEYCGLRVCAYPIRKNRKGHYFYMQIKASPDTLKETERYMKLNEEILRFLTVSVSKFDTGLCPLVQQKSEMFSKESSDTQKKDDSPMKEPSSDGEGPVIEESVTDEKEGGK